MKTLFEKKAIALYETKMRTSYVVKTVVFYVLAAILWYIIAVIAPYMNSVVVCDEHNSLITREAFSADGQIVLDEYLKERALLMPTGKSSFARRLRLIEDAKTSIDYMVFITYEQEYAYHYYTALLRAAERGVKIRIIVDGKMGRFTGELEEIGNMILNHNNIEVYYFNETDVFEPAGLMVLMHDKLTVVDGETVIIGGVNMGTDSYLKNYDMEVMITNSSDDGVAGQAERYFASMLSSGLVKRKRAKKSDFSAFRGI